MIDLYLFFLGVLCVCFVTFFIWVFFLLLIGRSIGWCCERVGTVIQSSIYIVRPTAAFYSVFTTVLYKHTQPISVLSRHFLSLLICFYTIMIIMSIHLPAFAGLDVSRARFFIISLCDYIHAVCQNKIALAHLEVLPSHSITKKEKKHKHRHAWNAKSKHKITFLFFVFMERAGGVSLVGLHSRYNFSKFHSRKGFGPIGGGKELKCN